MVLFMVQVGPATARAEPQKLVILTTADLHGQTAPFPTTTGNNTVVEAGGLARLASVIASTKERYPGKVLVVSTGDTLTGPFFLHFNGEALFRALSLAGVDVATLGNHEFDRGAALLAAALNHISFPLVVSNIEIKKGELLKTPIHESVVLERGNLKIGVFGLLTPDVQLISQPGKDIYFNPNLANIARRITQRLKAEQGVDIVIALTHIGLAADKKLAGNVKEIDVICGGHSHDLMQAGKEIIMRHPDGNKTIIVHTGARGEHLGRLYLTIENGRVINHQWAPLRIDASIFEHPGMVGLIRSYQKKSPPRHVLATASTALDCRSVTLQTREALVGNIITDSMRRHFTTDIALHNGGGIRGERIISAGQITTEDINTLLPFENSVVILKLSGAVLKQALERGVALLPHKAGGFLQVSGLRYSVNTTRKAQKLRMDSNGYPTGIARSGNRIVRVEVRQKDGSFQPLNLQKIYTVAVNSFLAAGGDGYIMLQNVPERTPTYVTLSSALMVWLKEFSEIKPELEGRIRIVN